MGSSATGQPCASACRRSPVVGLRCHSSVRGWARRALTVRSTGRYSTVGHTARGGSALARFDGAADPATGPTSHRPVGTAARLLRNPARPTRATETVEEWPPVD